MRQMPCGSQGDKFSFVMILVWSGMSCSISLREVLCVPGAWLVLPVLMFVPFSQQLCSQPWILSLHMLVRETFRCCVEMINNFRQKVCSLVHWMRSCHYEEFIHLLAVQAKQPEGRPKGDGINISQLLAEKASIAWFQRPVVNFTHTAFVFLS